MKRKTELMITLNKNYKEKIKLRIEPIGKDLDVIKGTPLIDKLFEYGIEFPCGGKGLCGGCKVKLLSGDVKNHEQYKELNCKLGLDSDFRLACNSELIEDTTIEIPQLESLILADNTAFTFTPLVGFGIAIDIGTTTIVAQLVDLSSSQVLGVQTSRNPQSRFGSDIMSRILHGLTTAGSDELKKLIREETYSLIKLLLNSKDINLKKIVLVGNSVMHHLFCGLDVQPLSMFPFATTNNESIEYSPVELDWELSSEVKIIFVRPISSFIGSDIYAGIIASGMDKHTQLTALIDLGTNGEIVVGSSDRMVCASTAAGPAFEGATIHMGMSAMSGAISSVNNNDTRIDYHVIGNQDALGICGSGLIDAVSVFLQNGSVDAGGTIVDEKEKLRIGDRVFLTQKDVREFQLAKGALAAGLQILVDKLCKSLDDITHIFIAGGFGNFINLSNVTRLGMIEVDQSKITKLGNSALIGAKMLLFTDDYSLENSISKIEHISLDSDENFQDIFVNKMFFNNYISNDIADE
ncbi:MAG: ASKHA domain-containing protein [Melioribacteraceae bacterium]|nr:ASKHA domain-containing protein [Melioribacteraceae bacterium]